MKVYELRKALENYAPGARVIVAGAYEIATIKSDGEVVDIDIIEEWETNP